MSRSSVFADMASQDAIPSIAIIEDQKSAGTAGGTFTSGAWRTRDLNTEVSDPDGIVSTQSSTAGTQNGGCNMGD